MNTYHVVTQVLPVEGEGEVTRYTIEADNLDEAWEKTMAEWRKPGVKTPGIVGIILAGEQ